MNAEVVVVGGSCRCGGGWWLSVVVLIGGGRVSLSKIGVFSWCLRVVLIPAFFLWLCLKMSNWLVFGVEDCALVVPENLKIAAFCVEICTL